MPTPRSSISSRTSSVTLAPFCDDTGVSKHLRVVTLNFWGIEPPLDRRLALAIHQLRALAPDVICMQEVRPWRDGDTGETTAELVADQLGGMHAHYATSVRWPAGAHGQTGAAGEEGLAIIAKTGAILETKMLQLPEPRPADARLLLSAKIATAAAPVWVHTTHLHYRLDDGLAREQQVLAVDAQIRACGRDASDAPQILCGDMNATPDSDEMRFLRGLTTLGGRRTHFQDAWLKHHAEPGLTSDPAAGITWSSENPQTRPLRSLDIDRRIDFIYVTSRKKDGRATVATCEVVLRDRAGDDAICASDHYGVMADVQVIPNDQ
jgi:endonuclease/exonuclease/phosphatase family metal-dependent hydrolase